MSEPFYFAVPSWMPTDARARVPKHLEETYDVRGRIEFVRSEPGFRLYRVVE